MENQNLMCSLDRVKDASSFCMCEGSPVFLCEEHASAHIVKVKDRIHFLYPAELYSHRSEDSFPTLLTLYRSKLEVLSELRSNLTRFDTCIQEVAKWSEDYIITLQQAAEMLISQLKSERGKLYERIEAAAAAIEAMNGQEEDPIVTAMRNYTGDKATLRLFEYGKVMIEEVKLPEFVRYSITEPICMRNTTEISHKPLAFLSGSLLEYSHSPGSPPIVTDYTPLFDLGTRYSVTSLSDTMIYVCGGLTESLRVSNIALKITGKEVVRVGNLIEPRYCHGVLYDPLWEYIYVFGGETVKDRSLSRLATCERISLSSFAPSPIPPMTHPRSVFNPCRFARLIYLCGGYGSEGSIEVYNPLLNLMSEIYAGLCDDVSCSSGCTSIPDGDSIVIISSQKLTRWKPGTSLSSDIGKDRKAGSPIWSTCHPVLWGRTLVVVCSDMTVRRVNIDSGVVEDAQGVKKSCTVM